MPTDAVVMAVETTVGRWYVVDPGLASTKDVEADRLTPVGPFVAQGASTAVASAVLARSRLPLPEIGQSRLGPTLQARRVELPEDATPKR